ncbi:hypothetical protein ACFE04_005684 [Oxalis oulophora]
MAVYIECIEELEKLGRATLQGDKDSMQTLIYVKYPILDIDKSVETKLTFLSSPFCLVDMSFDDVKNIHGGQDAKELKVHHIIESRLEQISLRVDIEEPIGDTEGQEIV